MPLDQLRSARPAMVVVEQQELKAVVCPAGWKGKGAYLGIEQAKLHHLDDGDALLDGLTNLDPQARCKVVCIPAGLSDQRLHGMVWGSTGQTHASSV